MRKGKALHTFAYGYLELPSFNIGVTLKPTIMTHAFGREKRTHSTPPLATTVERQVQSKTDFGVDSLAASQRSTTPWLGIIATSSSVSYWLLAIALEAGLTLKTTQTVQVIMLTI